MSKVWRRASRTHAQERALTDPTPELDYFTKLAGPQLQLAWLTPDEVGLPLQVEQRVNDGGGYGDWYPAASDVPAQLYAVTWGFVLTGVDVQARVRVDNGSTRLSDWAYAPPITIP